MVEQNYKIGDLVRIYRRSKSSIYSDIQAGQIPKPIKFARSSVWIKSEIDAAIEERKAAREGT